jgi:lipopolysaccharide/colanic/teichoic acid biosynthesis glycosyltransferase
MSSPNEWTMLALAPAAGAALVGVWRRALARRRASPLLLVGTGPVARLLAEALHARRRDVHPIADPGALSRRVREGPRPGKIVLALDEERARLPIPELLEAEIRGLPVVSGEELYEHLMGKLAIERLSPSSVLLAGWVRERRVHRWLLRAGSFAAALVALVVLAPLFALVAAAILVDSGRPVLFVQDRVGWQGRRFRLLKFRTMHPAEQAPSEWVRDNGHRITRLGAWLRRYRIDEWPQFVNVLRGEMNLVGPRPHPLSSYAALATVARNLCDRGIAIPYYSIRLLVRPGITGWAQVRYGYANGVEEEIEKLRYDLYYVKNRSLGLDLRILLQTLRIVLSGSESRKESNPRSGARSRRGNNQSDWAA